MKKINLDGEIQQTPKDVYRYIYKQLNDGYILGSNLDSLWDFFTGGVEGPIEIDWINTNQFRKRNPGEFEKFESFFERIMEYSKKPEYDVDVAFRIID